MYGNRIRKQNLYSSICPPITKNKVYFHSICWLWIRWLLESSHLAILINCCLEIKCRLFTDYFQIISDFLTCWIIQLRCWNVNENNYKLDGGSGNICHASCHYLHISLGFDAAVHTQSNGVGLYVRL